MISICRSAAMATARSAAFRAKTALPKSTPVLPSSRRVVDPILSRSVIAAVDSTVSLMPLHSAIASARLKSFIAVDSSRWSWLSQGRALPL